MRVNTLSAPIAAILTAGAATLLVVPTAGAETAPKSNGVGVCVSQVAVDPSLIDERRLGDAVKSMASPGTPGSDIPTSLDGDRNACGEPPGPGHL